MSGARRLECAQAHSSKPRLTPFHVHPSSFGCLIAASLIALVTGCAATSGEVAEPAGATYTARGNEPGWSLTVGTDRLTLITDYGKRRIVTPLPPKQMLAGGISYRYDARTKAHALRVHIASRVCRDTMSGVLYPDIVAVILDGERPLAGCGGAPESLLLGEWIVEDIDGAGIVDRSRATLNFQPDGRLAGRASCNSYTTRYAVTGEGLRIDGKIAATLMACPPALMQQERKFLDILQAVTAYDLRPDGALAITGAGGRTIVARKRTS